MKKLDHRVNDPQNFERSLKEETLLLDDLHDDWVASTSMTRSRNDGMTDLFQNCPKY